MKVDASRQAEAVRRLGVMGTPTLIGVRDGSCSEQPGGETQKSSLPRSLQHSTVQRKENPEWPVQTDSSVSATPVHFWSWSAWFQDQLGF